MKNSLFARNSSECDGAGHEYSGERTARKGYPLEAAPFCFQSEAPAPQRKFARLRKVATSSGLSVDFAAPNVRAAFARLSAGRQKEGSGKQRGQPRIGIIVARRSDQARRHAKPLCLARSAQLNRRSAARMRSVCGNRIMFHDTACSHSRKLTNRLPEFRILRCATLRSSNVTG